MRCPPGLFALKKQQDGLSAELPGGGQAQALQAGAVSRASCWG